MPFVANTPESLIARSDSKNPATTCRGITGSGRPCRRGLASSDDDLTPPSRKGQAKPDGEDMYCFHHKDQAGQVQASSSGRTAQTVKNRTSVETLVDRLGFLDVGDTAAKKQKRRDTARKTHLAEKEKLAKENGPPKQNGGCSFLCCFSAPDDLASAQRPVKKLSLEDMNNGIANQRTSVPMPRRPKRGSPSANEPLSLIPPSASPQLASQLLAELAKPVSELDQEGYIYMFWLTSTDHDSAPTDAATSLLSTPTKMPKAEKGRRKTSEVILDFSATTKDKRKKTIMLKIGRANNVQRRLNEWKRQCGYNLSLIRYYPYHGHSNPNLTAQPTKVPYANKVERLIHIELDAMRVQMQGKCDACGREHREWFEVDASRDGVKAVDETIRRWVDWSLRNPVS